jgi:hypothetical protein
MERTGPEHQSPDHRGGRHSISHASGSVHVDITAPAAALVLCFPLLMMFGMLAMNLVERRLTGPGPQEIGLAPPGDGRPASGEGPLAPVPDGLAAFDAPADRAAPQPAPVPKAVPTLPANLQPPSHPQPPQPLACPASLASIASLAAAMERPAPRLVAAVESDPPVAAR